MNNYVSHGAPKWPHIFISASGVPCRRAEVAGGEGVQGGGGRGAAGAGLRAASASTVMYHTAWPVLTVQLGAPPRWRPVSGNERRRAGQDQERLPQTHFRSRRHQFPPNVTQWGGQGEEDLAQDPCLIRLRPEGGIHPDQAGAEWMSLWPSQQGEEEASHRRHGRGEKPHFHQHFSRYPNSFSSRS